VKRAGTEAATQGDAGRANPNNEPVIEPGRLEGTRQWTDGWRDELNARVNDANVLNWKDAKTRPETETKRPRWMNRRKPKFFPRRALL